MSNFVQNENKLLIDFNHFISWLRFFYLSVEKKLVLLCNAIGVRNSFNHQIVNRSETFSRASRWLHVFTSCFDWFTVFSVWLAVIITLVLLDTQWKSALLQHWYDDYYTNYKIYFIIGPQLAIFYCLWLRWQERKLIFGRFSVWLPKWLFRVVVLHCLVSKAFDINFLAKSSFSIDVIKRKFNLPVITLNKSLSENYISCYKLTAYGRHN